MALPVGWKSRDREGVTCQMGRGWSVSGGVVGGCAGGVVFGWLDRFFEGDKTFFVGAFGGVQKGVKGFFF